MDTRLSFFPPPTESLGREASCRYICYIAHTSAAFITDGRIVFAVTKFDNYYTGSDEEELSAVDTQEHVREGLLELGFNVSLESIVPISGKWALRARQLQADPQQNMHLLKDARRHLTDCKEKEARGEDESIDCHEQVRRMEPREVATELQKASQILDLEKRFVSYFCMYFSQTSYAFFAAD